MPRTSDARARTLETAAHLFQRQGYHATPVSQVLEASGAPRGSLYFHFPGGKEQIAGEAVAIAAARLEHVIARARDRSTTPVELVGRIAGGLARWLEASDYTEGCPIATLTLELVPSVDDVTTAVREAFGRWIDQITAGLEDLEVSPERARSMALLAIAAIEGGLILSRAEQSTGPLRAVRSELMAVIGRETDAPDSPDPRVGNGPPAHQEVTVPVHRGKDSDGPYYQWGKSGKKYRYASGDKSSREAAKKKAEKQGQAAHAGGYKG